VLLPLERGRFVTACLLLGVARAVKGWWPVACKRIGAERVAALAGEVSDAKRLGMLADWLGVRGALRDVSEANKQEAAKALAECVKGKT